MKQRFVTLIIILTIIISCKKSEENPIVYQSTLSASDPSWYTGSGVGYSIGFSQGKYEISTTSSGSFAYAFAPVSSISYPYSISVDASIQLTDTSKLGYCGFIFNFVDINDYTALMITSGGRFGIFEFANGSYSMPVPITQTNALKQGSGVVNTIQLTQNSNSVEIRINDTVINNFTLALVSNGRVGLFAQSATDRSFTNTIGGFNNLVMKKL